MFVLYDENMNEIQLPEEVTPLGILIYSIKKERVTEKIEGSSRTIDFGSVHKDRDIEVRILLEAYDEHDYRLLRDEMYGLFDSKDKFYISEKSQRGKRYLVSVENRYAPEVYNKKVSEMNIQCKTVDFPFAESIATTQDIQRNGIDSEEDVWGYGMGLIDEDTLSYTQTITKGETIDIYNAGNVDVHPFEQELAITISGIRSSNKYFALTNMTNGSEFRATEGIKDGNVITIGRGTVKNNGSHFLRSTTKDFIILSQGNNRFKIDGVTSAHVRFDFRFYYK